MTTLINLLPSDAMRWQFNRRQIAVWTCTLTIVLLVLIALQNVLLDRERRLQQQIDRAEIAVGPLKQASQEIAKQQLAIQDLRGRLAVARSLEQADSTLQLLQIVSAACYALEGHIQLTSYRMDEKSVATVKGQLSKSTKLIVLRGHGENDAFVSALVSLLKDSSAFSEVTLQSSQAESDEGSARRTFQITCAQ